MSGRYEGSDIRVRVRALVFVLAALAVLGGLAVKNYTLALRYKTALEYSYQRAADDLAAYTENISTALKKTMYAGTPDQLETLSAKLWKESSAAKAALSQLPTSSFNLEKTYKFLAQVGEYAVSLSKKAAQGQALTEEESANLKALSGYADKLEESMLVIQDALQNGNAAFEGGETGGSVPVIGEDLAEFEEGFTAYPTLIYDGPFSDHLLQKEPQKLKGTEEISFAAAREKAAKAFNIDSGKLKNGADEEGTMPAYCFTFGDRDIAVTKDGGYISYMTDSRYVTTRAITAEEAVKKAENYLNWLEIGEMKLTYYEIADNILTANFAYVQDGVLCYSDLIKVSVAMDDGGIVGFDARGYLTNNHERAIGEPALSREEAAQSVSKALTVRDVSLVMIPSEGENERYCYEFKCTAGDEENVLVYINADTGKEEQILILMIDENGTLTI